MTTTRRDFLRYVPLAAASISATGQARAQSDWPSGTLRFVSSGGPGDPIDLRLRQFAEDLGPYVGNATRIVENKVGAGGIIAIQHVLNSPADGNTIIIGNAGYAILPTYNRQLPFVPLRDLVPVALSGITLACLVVPASAPEKTLTEWVTGVKKRRTGINYASGATAGLPHLYGLQVSKDFALNGVHVAYKGVNPALMSLMSGDSDYAMFSYFDVLQQVKDGKLRVLAVTGDQRSKFLPNVPTFAELGYRGYDRMSWSAYYVKAGTPAPILDKISNAINALNATAKWEARRAETYSTWTPMTRAQLLQMLRSDTEAWGDLMRRNDIYQN